MPRQVNNYMIQPQINVQLASHTTFGIGGPADFFVVAGTPDELFEAVSWAKEKNLPFFILGSGANILIGDKGFRGLVIKNEASSFSIRANKENKNTLLVVQSGALIADIIHVTLEKGLSGFEHFAGIPSTVGGALWQNLHFLSPDRTKTVYIADIVTSAEIISISENSLEKKEVDHSYFNFSYDYSTLHNTHDVVLSASFELQQKSFEDIGRVMHANVLWRQERHPKDAAKKSAGSIFKRIEGFGSGRLIEQVGLKGKRIGGAEISETHANFILNVDHATAKDVRLLIDLIQQTVKEKLDLTMQPEISFIGEF
ncbi:MAG: UDP-N-acetylmuramate dehydrogenase [Candidatus Levyibacteriota bacterium]